MTSSTSRLSDSTSTTVALGVIVLTVGVWVGAGTSGVLFGGGWPPGGFPAAFVALVHLPSRFRQPASAWPQPAANFLPGPLPYWSSTAAVFVILVVVAERLLHLRSASPGTQRRRRLGVDTRTRLARISDLAPLRVRKAIPGRFILGRVDGHYVATEDRSGAAAKSKRARKRQGDRSSVAIFGPTRSGKTASTISGVLEWEGPAILSSVKSDLLGATIAQRRCLGEVRIFDPLNSLNMPGIRTSQWTPLRAARTVTGAQQAARALADASPKGGAENLDFFANMAETLLWPLLFTAATSEREMRDVVRWILIQDRPMSEDDPGEIALLLQDRVQSGNSEDREQALAAIMALTSIWSLDERTRASTYATCSTMVQSWQDPAVGAATTKSEIDLEWLLSGDNTLYICAPMHEQKRLASLFGGVLGDLMNQAYERYGKTNEALPSTLVVMDEAGNTPIRWLPQVASTCAGIGILLVTIWQSKAQMDFAYGRLSDSVLTNHGTKVIFSGVSDPATLDYVSALVGDEEIRQLSTSTDSGGTRQSTSESTTRTRLVPSDVLRQVAPFEALLIHGTLRPAHLAGRPFYLDRRLSALARAGPRNLRPPLLSHRLRTIARRKENR